MSDNIIQVVLNEVDTIKQKINNNEKLSSDTTTKIELLYRLLKDTKQIINFYTGAGYDQCKKA